MRPFSLSALFNEKGSLVAIVFSVACIACLTFFVTSRTPSIDEAEVVETYNTHAFDTVTLEAKSAIVVDLNTGKPLYEYNADAQLPLASLTKLITVFAGSIVFGLESNIHVTKPIPVTRQVLDQVDVGRAMSFEEISKLVLMSSSNEGADVIGMATEKFVSKDSLVKTVAQKLSLTSTYAKSSSGLDLTDDTAGAYGSARDMSKLSNALVQTLPTVTFFTSREGGTVSDTSGKLYRVTNTNTDVLNTPGLIFSKTGYTDLAGGNLSVIVDIDEFHRVSIVVLGSTKEARFTDVQTLLQATQTYYTP